MGNSCCGAAAPAATTADPAGVVVLIDGRPVADDTSYGTARLVSIACKDFAACIVDHNVTISRGATLAEKFIVYNSLASGSSLRSGQSDSGKGLAAETLSSQQQSKIAFHVDLGDAAAPLTTATLKFFADPEAQLTGAKVLITVNSHTLPAVSVAPRYTGWVDVQVPAGMLVDGENAVIFRGADGASASSSYLFIDECYANIPAAIGSVPGAALSRSAKSFDGGATWHADCLGADGHVRGEYVVRLFVDGHNAAAGGKLVSPVLDLADPTASGAVIAPTGFSVTSVGATLDASAPKGTSVVCEVRLGSTPSVAAASWSPWVAVSRVCSGASVDTTEYTPTADATFASMRFAQWRCTLHTSSAAATPTLNCVTLAAKTGTAAAEEKQAWQGERPLPLVLSGTGNPPPLMRSGLEFVYMAPHPQAARLVHELRLNKVLEQAVVWGKQHMPTMAADFAQIVGLRTWAHAQWWGWQEAMPLVDHCPTWSALDVLHTVKDNFGFGQCTHYAAVFSGCAAACGFAVRSCVMGGAGARDGGHCIAEAYVPSLRKWVVMDAGPGNDYSTHYTDASGTPLNCVEMHALVGPPPSHPGASKLMAFKTTRLNALPTIEPVTSDPHLKTFIPHISDSFSIPNRNDYTCAPELTYGPGQQGWLGYHYGGLLHYVGGSSGGGGGTKMHQRDDAIFTTSRLADMYPSVGETRLYAQHAGGGGGDKGDEHAPSSLLSVRVETSMPNWERYEVQRNGTGAWAAVTEGGEANARIEWAVPSSPQQQGSAESGGGTAGHSLAVRAVSRFGVVGPPAVLTVQM